MNWKTATFIEGVNLALHKFSITIKKNGIIFVALLGRNMTEGLAVLIIANVANAMKTIKAVTANKGKC